MGDKVDNTRSAQTQNGGAADAAANTGAASSIAAESPDPSAAAAKSAAAKRPPYSPFVDDHLLDDFGPHDCREMTPEGNWSVPWSDLMMVMFLLFAALLTAQLMREQEDRLLEREVERETIHEVPAPPQVDEPRYVDEPVPAPQADFAPLMRINVFESSKQALRQANIDNVELVLMRDKSVKVSVQGPMLFELGRAELRNEVKAFLASLAHVIRQTDFKVNVIGHTDDNPINTELFPSNWELSVVRASRVARFIIDQGGIGPARFTVMGRSQYQPVQPGDSDAARAQNRRVEIIITRETVNSLEGIER